MRIDRKKVTPSQGSVLKSLAPYLLSFSLSFGATVLTYGGHIFASTGPCDKESFTPGEPSGCSRSLTERKLAVKAEHWEVAMIPDLHLHQVLRWIYSRYAPRDGHIRIVDDIH